MDSIFSIVQSLIGLAWLLVVISIVKAAKKSSKKSRNYSGRPSRPASGAQQPYSSCEAYSPQESYPAPAAANSKPRRPARIRNINLSPARNEVTMDTFTDDSPEHGLRASSVLREDRTNDWLARQIREETRILMRSEMYELKEAHAAFCEARELKESHKGLHGRD